MEFGRLVFAAILLMNPYGYNPYQAMAYQQYYAQYQAQMTQYQTALQGQVPPQQPNNNRPQGSGDKKKVNESHYKKDKSPKVQIAQGCSENMNLPDSIKTAILGYTYFKAL